MTTVQLNKIENRRVFFEKYAKQHNFDPRKAENWYSQPKERIMVQKVLAMKAINSILILLLKGSHAVVFHHNNSLLQALLDIFPDIGLEAAKFRVDGKQ